MAPAQIRTGAFTHTALTVDEWRRNVLHAAHRAIPGTCASRSVSDACVIERCSPQSVPCPPQPPPKAGCPSLFGWFTGTTAQVPLLLYAHVRRSVHGPRGPVLIA